MIHLHRPGDSILHRAPASLKLATLVVASLVLSLAPQSVWSIGGALLLVCALYALARFPAEVLVAEIRRISGIALVLGVLLWLFASPAVAWISTGRVVALVLLAALLTLTTRMTDLLGVLRRMTAPVRRIGVDPDAVAMTLSLAVTMIPVVQGFADQVRDAQRARDARLGVRWVVPLLVRALRHADDVGDALAARGLG